MTATAELLAPDTTQAEAELSPLIQQANELVIDSQATNEEAGELLRDIRTKQKWWTEFIGPSVKAAHQAHQAAKAVENKIAVPLKKAGDGLGRRMGVYTREEDEKRRARELELQKQADKQAEDRQIAEAAQLENEGRQEEADAMIAAPVAAPAVVLRAPPKPAGTSYRANWQYRILNTGAIPLAFMMPDHGKLLAYAKSHKADAKIPGVQFYDDGKTAARTY